MLNNIISNIQKMTKDGKESYFGRRWSSETAFQKNVDRRDFTFEEVSQASPAKQLNDHFLTRLQQSPDSEKSLFVERLTNESLNFLARREGKRVQQMQQAALENESMTALMGRIFARLESYSLELNAYLGCTDLHTVVTRPCHVREVIRYSKARQPLETITYFRARIGTHHWSLVMRGREGRIEFFLLPVERIMALSKAESMFEPIAVLSATVVHEVSTVYWEYEEKPLSALREQDLCMHLFSELIKSTRGQMELGELEAETVSSQSL